VSRDIDADLGERLDGERMTVSGRFAAGAGDCKSAFIGGAENAFRHVAATGIAGAENENQRLVVLHGVKRSTSTAELPEAV
jgi:hypothetical protein